jgi:hypothetical protein
VTARQHARNILMAGRTRGQNDHATYGTTHRAFGILSKTLFISKSRAMRVLSFMRKMMRGELE